jgi:hypothetical protein
MTLHEATKFTTLSLSYLRGLRSSWFTGASIQHKRRYGFSEGHTRPRLSPSGEASVKGDRADIRGTKG